ncbi:DUF2147 domain-containing protein [Emticicia sp. SJ17W-69]|uniref:DUF2147 domain-containing protein n=1 Tax=Emticicia sp. SJ17W-69 TaxID=3421657 RepID=UPI003EB8510D
MKTLLFISFLLINVQNYSKPLRIVDNSASDKIIGKWLSEEHDLKVEMYKKNNFYFGKVIWFACIPETPNMEDFKDTENPNPKLRSRKWLGLEVVENLIYNGKSTWENGTIYDPNSGRTYSAVVRLKDPNTLIVRGYWGIELFGKNLEFHRVN